MSLGNGKYWTLFSSPPDMPSSLSDIDFVPTQVWNITFDWWLISPLRKDLMHKHRVPCNMQLKQVLFMRVLCILYILMISCSMLVMLQRFESVYFLICSHVHFMVFVSFLKAFTLSIKRNVYRKGTSIRQAPVFRHLRALRNSPWKFIIWMNEL